MDNFEHVRAGVGDIIRLLQAAPKLKVLATSRARLNVQSEQLFPLDGLDFPADPVSAPPSSAEQLFVQAARQVRPDFQVTAENGPAIARICRLVQGMPLGILLAAAWVEILSPVEIVIQLGGEETGQTLDFLQTDWQDVTERQRSLRAVFDHSWRLLTDEERSAFRQMSVFRGGFTIEAAEKVSGASLQTLLALVNKSLLRRVQRGRFEMHELLRQFGVEKLGQETTAVRDRHCAYYAAFLRARNEDLKGARQLAALAELEADNQNLRAAWQWAVDQHQLPQLRQAVDGLAQFYQWQGRYQEGEALFERAIEHLATQSTPAGLRVLLRVSVWQASFCSQLQPAETVTQLFQQCQALVECIPLSQDELQAECAFLYRVMAEHLCESDYDEARRIAEQGLALYKELNDSWAIAQTLQVLSHVDFLGGNYLEATQWLEEALTIQRSLGDRRGLARSLRYLGLIVKQQGHLTQAEQLHREALSIFRELDDRHGTTNLLRTLGITLGGGGRLLECLEFLEESLTLYRNLGFHSYIAEVQMPLGRFKIHCGQYDAARPLLQKSLSLAQKSNNIILADTYWTMSMLTLAEEDFQKADSLCQKGIELYRQIKHTALLGCCLAIQGLAARSLDQLYQAAAYLTEALQCGLETGSTFTIWHTLPAIALLLVDQGDFERAIELYALATRYPLVRNSRWFEDVAGRHIAAAAKALPPEVVAAAQVRGQARDLWQTVEEILAAPVQFGLA